MSKDEGLKFDFSTVESPAKNPDEVRVLPTWGLPSDLRKVIEEVSEGYQCSRDYALSAMMAAAASAIGKRASSHFGNHLNYGSLWIAIVGGTSSGKTSPLSFFFNPIEERDFEAWGRYKQSLKAWKADKSNCEDEPKFRHILINNASDEAVLTELANNESVCWCTDELRTMFAGFGKYSGNSGQVVGNLLSIFNNKSIPIARTTSEPKYLHIPNLNIVGSIQPSVLRSVMRGGRYTDDGLFQRFLYVYPEQSEVPPYKEVKISEESRRVWRRYIENLCGMGEVYFTETPEAALRHVDAINRWRDTINADYQDNEAMASLLRKLEIHLCRWYIVAAAIESFGYWGNDPLYCNTGTCDITDNIVEWSIECMDYFRWTGEKTYCLIANDNSELSRGLVFSLLSQWYPKLNQSKLGEALNISQQAVSKFLKK